MKKMRISKLFHWLYATLMLAPIFAIGISCLTHVFNKETGIVGVDKYETLDKSYIFDDEHSFSDYDFNFYNKYVRATGDNLFIGSDIYTDVCKLYTNFDTYLDFSLFESNDYYFCEFFEDSGDIYFCVYDVNIGEPYILVGLVSEDFNYVDFLIPSQDIADSIGFVIGNAILSPVPSEDIPKNIVSSYEENIFYYSVDKAMNSPYFSWASDSFLVEPFKYLGNLFNVPSDNPIYLLLSYWLDISLIWLVFDLVMYIPMLVHSWIDNSAIGD